MIDWQNNVIDEKKAPLVTVVIPTYKRTVEYLSRAVRSVVDQTYKSVEIIVIDDSPSDYEHRSNVKNYMESITTNAIHYYQNENNMGGSLARNRGISLASGVFISFLDDDDEYMVEKIEKQVKFMLSGKYDLSFSNMIMYSTSGKVVDYREYADIPAFDNETLLHYHLMKHLTGTPTFMFTTEKLREIDGFVDAKMGQEFYLMLKSIEKGLFIGYLPECDVKVYKHADGGITQGKNKIDGENKLYNFKKQYFNRLESKEIKFINFRHWAVMVVAYKRNGMYFQMLLAGIKALISSPTDFVSQVAGFLRKIVKNRKNDK
jgi:glycosyltransferase involved in cell wall biosynthesis